MVFIVFGSKTKKVTNVHRYKRQRVEKMKPKFERKIHSQYPIQYVQFLVPREHIYGLQYWHWDRDKLQANKRQFVSTGVVLLELILSLLLFLYEFSNYEVNNDTFYLKYFQQLQFKILTYMQDNKKILLFLHTKLLY